MAKKKFECKEVMTSKDNQEDQTATFGETKTEADQDEIAATK